MNSSQCGGPDQQTAASEFRADKSASVAAMLRIGNIQEAHRQHFWATNRARGLGREGPGQRGSPAAQTMRRQLAN